MTEIAAIPASTIPAFLLHEEPALRFMVADDLSLLICDGDQVITLVQEDLARLRAFLARFED